MSHCNAILPVPSQEDEMQFDISALNTSKCYGDGVCVALQHMPKVEQQKTPVTESRLPSISIRSILRFIHEAQP